LRRPVIRADTASARDDQAVVKGYDDGYHPGEIVKRDQMAMYICRAFELPT